MTQYVAWRESESDLCGETTLRNRGDWQETSYEAADTVVFATREDAEAHLKALSVYGQAKALSCEGQHEPFYTRGWQRTDAGARLTIVGCEN